MKTLITIITCFYMHNVLASEISIQKLDEELAADYKDQLIKLVKTDENDRFATHDGESPEQILQDLTAPGKVSYIATHDEKLLGFSTHAYTPDMWVAEYGAEFTQQMKEKMDNANWDESINIFSLHHLLVHPEYRGKSVGTTLMKKVIYEGKLLNISGILIGVKESNTAAMAFYQKMGAKKVEGMPENKNKPVNLKLNLRKAN